jgi:AhpD family alkylhydroperoxidase
MTTPRFTVKQHAPKSYRALIALDKCINESGIEAPLLYLIYVRISQINGCAYCTDAHWKDARSAGAAEEKMARVVCWRESPGFSERERAALDWAEAVTDLAHGHVSDAAYESARAQFSEQEISHLTLAIAAMNLWNRIGVSSRMVPGE